MRTALLLAVATTCLVAAEPPFYADKSDLLVYLDGAGKSQPVKTPADWQRRRGHILANMQLVMGPLPEASRRVDPAVEVTAESDQAKFTRKKITFAVEKDDRVSAYLLIPKNLKGKTAAMLCLHQTTALGKGEPAGVGGLKNLHYAEELAERGYVTLAPDYPNFGDYKLDVYSRGYASATMKGIWNHMRAVDLLQSLPEVDGDRIGVIGHSLGGHNSLFVAAFDPRLKVVVTSCGFNSFTKYMKGDLKGWSHKGYMPRIATEYGADAKKMPFDFPEILGAIAPRAVFINAPVKDDNFEVSGVKDCVTAARPIFALLGDTDDLQAVYPDSGHDFPPEQRQQAYQFIDRHLRHPIPVLRLVAHWDQYGSPDYLSFIEEARPEVAQVGFYGGHFWSLAHTPHGKGYPAHFPLQGLSECGQWFEKLNGDLHKRNVKVVGHFNVGFLVGDPESKEGPRGFFKFYRDLWDEKELGPRPTKDPLDLLEKNADGTPRISSQYGIGGMKEYHACLNNPHWRTVLKAWAKRGIDRGVDGYMINYFYRGDCLCEHCRKGFKDHLAERFTPEQIKERFGIADLAKHEFSEIVGWHNPKESTPLRREMLRFSQISTKRAFDEVFVQYARSLKPDLIVGQWDHLGDFQQISGDERCLLPANLWGRDEDYLWYSTGGAANFTDLEAGILGEATLQARYIRGAFGKPFTLGKYEQTRLRVAIAELAANGGAPMGFYTPFTNPDARTEIVRYYHFLERYDSLYRGCRPEAEVLLLYPRSKVHEGDLEAVESFKKLGKKLLDEHVLFEVRPDDMVPKERRKEWKQVLEAGEMPGDDFFAGLGHKIDAPATVRASANWSASGKELTVHFVNYDRQEPEKKRSPGSGIADEKPVAVEGVKGDLLIPAGMRVGKVVVVTPEEPEPVELNAAVQGGRLGFTVPKFLVYAVVRVEVVKQ